VPDAALGQCGPGARGERVKDDGVKRAIGEMARGRAQIQPERIERSDEAA